jgi:hypothetical protein
MDEIFVVLNLDGMENVEYFARNSKQGELGEQRSCPVLQCISLSGQQQQGF